MKYFIYSIIGVVTIAVIAGFFIVGSPGDERARRFDEQRVSDLQVIQNQILSYWQNKGSLPDNLTDLRDDISGFSIPQDPSPEATSTYSYIKKGDNTFSLCAIFVTSNYGLDVMEPHPIDYRGINSNWTHYSGKTCFDRTIDKDLYKQQ